MKDVFWTAVLVGSILLVFTFSGGVTAFESSSTATSIDIQEVNASDVPDHATVTQYRSLSDEKRRLFADALLSNGSAETDEDVPFGGEYVTSEESTYEVSAVVSDGGGRNALIMWGLLLTGSFFVVIGVLGLAWQEFRD
ncbi:hypothetical protein [Halococcoides cellulosivorans]|uniref:DUF7979 domain-containing protein n=1 Tax=Halococcoides cellulosivorans TaxID=1679096 RepID=A0A2R4WZX1_9EURY|nr:hypothetical protein [Halococcoides cellulosivorans]AWB27094.1 hypothetical protein HARCEL1_04915 [Halococcoides cellulosivorans]